MKSQAEAAVERANPLVDVGGGFSEAFLSQEPVIETQEQCAIATSHQEFELKQQQQHKTILPLTEHPSLPRVTGDMTVIHINDNES